MPEIRPHKNSRAPRRGDRRRRRDRPRRAHGARPRRGCGCASSSASEPGSGASGVAAGMLAPVGEATWGEEELLDAALASHAMWPEFAAELVGAGGRSRRSSKNGALHVALDADEAAELEAPVRPDALAGSRGGVAHGPRVPRARAGAGPVGLRRGARAARGRGGPDRGRRGASRARARRRERRSSPAPRR